MLSRFFGEGLIEFLFFSVSILALIYASYTDLKERIVNDWLTYGLIGFGLIANLAYGVISNSMQLFYFSTAATIGTFIAGYGLWKIGLWAGGDVKLFTAIAAMNPLNYGIIRNFIGLNDGFFSSISLPVFPLTLFFYMLLCIVPYGAMLALKETIKNSDLRKELFQEGKMLLISLIKLGIILVGLTEAFNALKIPIILILPALLIIGFQKKIMNELITLLLLIEGILFIGFNALTQILSIALPLFGIYFLIRFFLVSRKFIFSEKKKISELKEGEIIGETIVLIEGKPKIIEQIEIKKIINYIKDNKFNELFAALRMPEGRIIASSRSAAGITEEQLNELRELAEKNEIENSITVKKSAPLVPAVLIAYILSQIIGDIIWNAMLKA